jgi:UTP--glucose-1-phosphate uridylyltransferase
MPVTHAIFPVAGLGTRSLPATKSIPKEMLPVVDKPLIQYAVEEAYAAGVRQMIFVTGRHKRALEDHFDFNLELELALEKGQKQELLEVVRAVTPADMECVFVRQAQALGLGHAVLCGRRLVGNNPFAVLLPDDLMIGTPSVLAQMVTQFDKRQGSIIAVQEVPSEHTRRYGIVGGTAVDSQVVDITAIVEKPAPESRRRASASPALCADAPRLRRDREPAARRRRRDPAHRRHRGLLRHEKVFAYRYEGKRYDCGSKEGFLQANVELGLAHPAARRRVQGLPAVARALKTWNRCR